MEGQNKENISTKLSGYYEEDIIRTWSKDYNIIKNAFTGLSGILEPSYSTTYQHPHAISFIIPLIF
ncbi:MAG TPA: hypothetical protein VKA95_05615 [Nitrososphaeraceae archaeon]|nr:hypothetical protein [Nitrososphaeraceae archaeon]